MAPITRICRVAGAKLNLALHVRGRRPDGYHNLESVFVHCVDGDELWAEPADTVSLCIAGPFSSGLSGNEDNLVMRAARAVEAGFADIARPSWVPGGAAITLVKNLPLASGIGGGSADAAMTIELLVALWDLPDDAERMEAIGAALGADVVPCMYRFPKRISGRGEHYERLHDPAYHDWPVLLVNPGVELATGEVFARWDGTDRGQLDARLFSRVIEEGRNDLEAPARALAPVIGEVIDLLADQPGAIGARMSGSGATCFALFGSAAQRDAARSAIRSARPGWWTMASRLS